MTPELVTFSDDLAEDFARLNYEWIQRYFAVEDEDVKSLSNPRAYVIDPGGEIFFVRVDGATAGTVAMMPMEDGVWELAKMAVDPAYQGMGLSHLLMNACIEFARSKGACEVMLVTNDSLAPALALYRSAGFEPAALYSDARYSRGNLEMRLKIG